jgi:uncharacterized Zn finger protein
MTSKKRLQWLKDKLPLFCPACAQGDSPETEIRELLAGHHVVCAACGRVVRVVINVEKL